MPKTKLQKQETFRDLVEKMKKANSIVFASYNALTVKDNEALRQELRKENAEYFVAKKTLMNLAFKDQGLEGANAREFDGKVATIFAYGDQVAPAKVLFNFKKDKDKAEKIQFVGGFLDGRFITKSEVEALSQLPGRQELYAKMLGSLNAPVSGFVNVLGGNLRGLVTALKAIADAKA
jgi:large subunit ribosomal protein L10